MTVGDGEAGPDPALRVLEIAPDRWRLRWEDGWVASLAAGLTSVVDHVRGEPELRLTDASGTTFDHDDLVAVVSQSTDSVMSAVRSDELTTEALVDLGASAANLAIVANAGLGGGVEVATDPLLPDGTAEVQGGLVAARDLFHRLAERIWSALDPGVRRLEDGRFELAWRAADRSMVGVLAGELDKLLDSDDPSIVRLFPPAYGPDTERSAGYDALARHELIDRRRASLEVLRSAMESGPLDVEGLEAVMRAVNDLRLVLGTRLDVTEDQEPRIRMGDPDAAAMAAYLRLSQLLGQILGALEESSGDPDPAG